MARYLEYLRKSRMDSDYEDASVEETLSRHRQILEKFCEEKKLNVVEILEEVVSGESLAARPKMMRLLELVNTGLYDGVVCMDIERLSRGSSMESGYIMQVFQANACKIVTPGKTYDLQNESDEQFTDMKFLFSRFELKTINKRLVRGRNQSASEGKFMGSMAPYGYEPYKLPGVKGNSLRIIPHEAEVVRMIFDMYGKQGMGYNAIAYQLIDLGIPSRVEKWGSTSIVNIINNEVYLGKIRWRREPVKRVIKDGFMAKKRILNDDYELYDGLHEAIITQEQWDLAKKAQGERNHTSNHADRQLRNSLAGVLFCDKCGRIMKRYVPDAKKNPTPWFRCMTRGCDCKMIKCATVEQSIRDAMENWLAEYIIQINSKEDPIVDPIETALHSIRAQLDQLQHQQESICEYLEKGIYTVDVFAKRNASLSKEIKALQASESELLQQKANSSKQIQLATQLIPTAQHILDNYANLSVEERNQLWKCVLKKATVYRSPDDEVTVKIYPNLPK